MLQTILPHHCSLRIYKEPPSSMSVQAGQLLFSLLLALLGGHSLAFSMPRTCEANGRVYYVGEWYTLELDPCSQCECTLAGPVCTPHTECGPLPPACIHVSHYPSDCCPRCERIGCEYRGAVYELGQPFQPSECEQCTCDMDGIARCLVADCAPPACVNPKYEKGKCCPECKDGPNCYSDFTQSHVIPGGTTVWVDKCTSCHCHDGQDVGYWEGNRVAKCVMVPNCILNDDQN
ncbi:von Willebrand factor C domain-containing protein 2-like [Chiloscyllium plagiosum]|uniref:von Willebrand factor C domain-containing protein 2-like n=1 Tax=Chiloscyllium plagiosum TaxID=36176 RepID=UPI001CB84E3A|nr:von Willebrand factor C domain-containing protein 2-like [Chiloscyllium plagiosum]